MTDTNASTIAGAPVVKVCLSAVMALWLAAPAALHTLVVLSVIDYTTGVLAAFATGTVCAAVGYRGLAKKVLTLILVGTAQYIVRPFSLTLDLGSIVALMFALNEGISIVENAAKAGVPIPRPLLDALVRAKKLAGPPVDAAEVEKELRK